MLQEVRLKLGKLQTYLLQILKAEKPYQPLYLDNPASIKVIPGQDIHPGTSLRGIPAIDQPGLSRSFPCQLFPELKSPEVVPADGLT